MNTLARPSPLPRPDRAAHTAPSPGQESRSVPGPAPITAVLIQRAALPVGALETSPEASASGAFLGEVA